jgi:Zn-dependent protease with chaperone function
MIRRVVPLPWIWGPLALGCLLGAGASGAITSSSAPLGDQRSLQRVAAAHFDAEFLARAKAFQHPRLSVLILEMVLTLIASIILLAGPWSAWARSVIPRWLPDHSTLSRIWILSAIYLGFEILQFPFRVFFYLHSRRAGLRHDAWPSFLGDWGKVLIIGWVQVVLVGLLALWLLAAFPRWGWCLGAAGIGLLAGLYMIVAPIGIDPLFNRFHSLDDAALRDRLLALAAAGGVPAREILVADASRRTRAVNAYFTGLGRTRRIVVYDTLLEKFDADEIAIVLAHEAGHWKHHDVVKGLAWGTLGALLALGSLSWFLSRAVALHPGLYGRADPALAIPAYGLAMLLLLLSTAPVNAISRRMETQADLASLQLTRDPQTFVRSEVHLARENLSDPAPPGWVEHLLYSHPCSARRILLAERFP